MPTNSLKKRCSFALCAAIFAGLCAGCGNASQLETAHVTGKVMLDRQPLTGGIVMFTPVEGRAARGVIRPDGTFTLSTYGEEDGAIVGRHRVAVIPATTETPTGAAARKAVDHAPQKYHSPGTSGLAVEVKPGEPNDIVLDLTR